MQYWKSNNIEVFWKHVPVLTYLPSWNKLSIVSILSLIPSIENLVILLSENWAAYHWEITHHSPLKFSFCRKIPLERSMVWEGKLHHAYCYFLINICWPFMKNWCWTQSCSNPQETGHSKAKFMSTMTEEGCSCG